MKLNKDHPKYIEAFTYVKRSSNREKIVDVLAQKRRTPSDIVKVTNARFSIVSKILSDLKDKGVVVCINEDDKTGRLYQLTELGVAIHEELHEE